MDDVFRALADPSRRELLDRLQVRQGQSLRELGDGLGMARQSVSKHLAILEAAGLVTTVRQGREKLHYLNAAPINEIRDRWISHYDRGRVEALADLKTALEASPMSKPTFVYTTYIRTTPEQLWAGLTDPAFTQRYWDITFDTDWRVGSRMIWTHHGVVIDDPEQVVLASEPYTHLSYTWHSMTPALADHIGFDPAAPEAEAIVVPKDSALKTVADLKGRKVALNKGSNVHYLLVKALEKQGLKITDIQPVYLPPADARAAFERGAVDAWVIWDPFFAAVEQQSGARLLADGRSLVNNYAYYLAERGFAEKQPQVIQALFDDTQAQATWLKANLKAAAAVIAPLQGLSPEVVEKSLTRYQFGVKPLNATVAAEQQKIADTFHALGLIPKPIRVADALPGNAKLAEAAR